jgi:hypothetical protein
MLALSPCASQIISVITVSNCRVGDRCSIPTGQRVFPLAFVFIPFLGPIQPPTSGHRGPLPGHDTGHSPLRIGGVPPLSPGTCMACSWTALPFIHHTYYILIRSHVRSAVRLFNEKGPSFISYLARVLLRLLELFNRTWFASWTFPYLLRILREVFYVFPKNVECYRILNV